MCILFDSQYTTKPPARKHVLRSHPHLKGLATDWLHTFVNNKGSDDESRTTQPPDLPSEEKDGDLDASHIMVRYGVDSYEGAEDVSAVLTS